MKHDISISYITFTLTLTLTVTVLLLNDLCCINCCLSQYATSKTTNANQNFRGRQIDAAQSQSADYLGYNIISYSTRHGDRSDLTVRIKRDDGGQSSVPNTQQRRTTLSALPHTSVAHNIVNSTDFPPTTIANVSALSNDSESFNRTSLEVTSTASLNGTVGNQSSAATQQPMTTASTNTVSLPQLVTANTTVAPSFPNDTGSPAPASQRPTTNHLVTSSSVGNSINASTTSTTSTTPKPVTTTITELPLFLTNTSLPPNITNTTTEHDDRKYYAIKYISEAAEARSYWRNLDNPSTHSTLKGHKVALVSGQAVQLIVPWNFKFYGHDVNRITVAIGGFLYMSPFLHQFLTATQYVAPLMANFDSTEGVGSGDSNVFFSNLEDALVVEWRNVHLQDQVDAGGFTFQAQLYKETGKIIFAYKNVPVPVGNISTATHSVKVGIADAYYQDYGPFRTIFDYHNIGIDLERVTTDSAVILIHKTTCNLLDDCAACHSADLPDFQCHWCESLQRCSDSLDRGRQEWMLNSCPVKSEDREICIPSTTTTSTTTTTTTTSRPITSEQVNGTISEDPSDVISNKNGIVKDYPNQASNQQLTKSGKTSGLVIGITVPIVCVAILVVVVIIFVYGYRNPTSVPGQFIIKYRPRELSRRWNNRGDREDHYRVDSQTLSNDAYEGEV